MIDLVIRGGQIIDGSGSEPGSGDVAIDAGRIVEVGTRCTLAARREISADGAYVTPGFVDIHTHYDAQVLWDPLVSPSSEHGVTSVVVGNCGLGLAPARESDRPALKRLLGGVEDIPQETLDEGIRWSWEDYPEYLDALDANPRSVEVGALVGHAALRVYAMGAERAFRDAARPGEISEMADQLRRALGAGALGLSTSRSGLDRDCDGRPTPSYFAEDKEFDSLADVLGEQDRGICELSFRGSAGDDPDALEGELAWMRDFAARAKRPVTFGLAQFDAWPDLWKLAYDRALDARAAGIELRPQTLGRLQSVLVGLQTVHPFAYRPSYLALGDLPLAERVRRMRDPGLRQRILSEAPLPAPESDPFSALFDYARRPRVPPARGAGLRARA